MLENDTARTSDNHHFPRSTIKTELRTGDSIDLKHI